MGEGDLQEKTGEKVLNIFLPTTPNPTSGYYLLVPEKDAIPLNLTIDQAFKLIISAGMVGHEALGSTQVKPGGEENSSGVS
jgi:uncharacterized membrane protein